jgi:hypothetical protein
LTAKNLVIAAAMGGIEKRLVLSVPGKQVSVYSFVEQVNINASGIQ